MKKNTLLSGLLVLFTSNLVFSQDLVIETMKRNNNIELIRNAKFDIGYGNVGNTNTETIICLGEVDFGANSNNYQATGVEFGQGWGNFEDEKIIVLHAGSTFETSKPFNEMTAFRTFGYHSFDLFAENMKEGENFERPIGTQKVWLTFRKGNGNLRSIKFYKDKVEEGLQPWPNELPGYEDRCIVIEGSTLERAIAIDPENDPFKECKYNSEKECWGGIVKDFIAKSVEPIDFGNGEYQQLVAFIGHDGERYKEYMEFYIDDVKPENLIARTWSGINLQAWNDFTPLATKMKKITGKHQLFVKWDGATNLRKIELVKEPLWFENPICGVIYEDIKPTDEAVEYATIGKGTTGGDLTLGQIEWSVVVPGSSNAHGEGSNIGFTSNGVVVAYHNIDFKNGEYKKVIINHSCDKNWLGSIEESNFSLYIDLEKIDFSLIKKPEDLKLALEAYEPIAIVRAQGTNGWDVKMGTAAALKEVKGVHSIYIVYNIPSGCNIHNLYLEPEAGVTGIDPATTIDGFEIFTAHGDVIVKAKEPMNIAIYTISGTQVCNKTLNAGNNTIEGISEGIYILKATGRDGVVCNRKVIIK